MDKVIELICKKGMVGEVLVAMSGEEQNGMSCVGIKTEDYING